MDWEVYNKVPGDQQLIDLTVTVDNHFLLILLMMRNHVMMISYLMMSLKDHVIW